MNVLLARSTLRVLIKPVESSRPLWCLLAAAWLIAAATLAATPCEKVDQQLTEKQKRQLSPVIARQLAVKKTEVLEVYRYQDWSILYVETYETDETFFFFHGNPALEQYVTKWSGAAGSNEEGEIKAWVVKNAPGIPGPLADCFAWHVTQARGK